MRLLNFPSDVKLREKFEIQTELAYIAGIIDGEGSISIRKHSNRNWYEYQLRVDVKLTDQEIPYWFQELFGGGVCFRAPIGNRKPAWQWTITDIKAANFLSSVQPYLHIKSEHCKIVLEFQETKRHVGYRRSEVDVIIQEGAWAKMALLNHRGKPIL